MLKFKPGSLLDHLRHPLNVLAWISSTVPARASPHCSSFGHPLLDQLERPLTVPTWTTPQSTLLSALNQSAISVLFQLAADTFLFIHLASISVSARFRCRIKKTGIVRELCHNSRRLSHSLDINHMQKPVNAVGKENKHCEFVYVSSELNLLHHPFFHNGKDSLEDFDYNDPRCNPLTTRSRKES
ncbi:DEAD-box ATP-dependent RNA helicase 37-like [Dorcoceras hygrometricum]|uniref:DEAD-box ATP-dependent RNA helicase 37-like n=1 Tax=Dorcoceras hygrometricum TaxID=472368 RepID=A0A2Z6ZYW2_9LAMI|nr:DEAD-box ATP-dependent RNA helicase 37-like [Dorcoceras hygrometricum]